MIIVKIKKRAIKGIPAGCIGVKTDVLIESRMFIYFPIEILLWNYYNQIILSIQKLLLYINALFDTIKIIKLRIGIKLSKIREKKLNSIKSEMNEIKKYIASKNDLDNPEHDQTNYLSNNDEDTVTLTKIVRNEDKNSNYNNLGEIKKELIELKKAIDNNNNLLNEILLKIK